MRIRRGFSLAEVLIVVVILGAIWYRLLPTISELKARSALRASRLQLTAMFAAARAAALQKGQPAWVVIDPDGASVKTAGNADGKTVTLLGPVLFGRNYGTALNTMEAAPDTVTFDSRGLVTPATAAVYHYRLSNAKWADTVCVSGSGLVLTRGCVL
jgi:prepilin-type N-terminal cleavage/methylation domain-containing protein